MLEAAQGCSHLEESYTAIAQNYLFIAHSTITCAQVLKWKWIRKGQDLEVQRLQYRVDLCQMDRRE